MRATARQNEHSARQEADYQAAEPARMGNLTPGGECENVVPERRCRDDEGIFGGRDMAREKQAHGERDVEKGRAAETIEHNLPAHYETASGERRDGERYADDQTGIDDDVGDRQAVIAHEFVERGGQAPEAA